MRRYRPAFVALIIIGACLPSESRAAGVKDLLPDLVPLSTGNVVAGNILGTCHPLEMVEQGAQRCLRFDQNIANFGAGPFELRYGIETLVTTQELRQRVYRSDGTFRDRFADEYEFHAAHAHFHYKGFGLTRLWQSDDRGRRLGKEPLRSGRKNGFCVIDIENHWAGEPGSVEEAQYTSPQCEVPTSFDGSAVEMVQGISPGWSDIYTYDLEGQYVESTGIPDGLYLLETIADPDNTVLEKNERNNRVFTHFQLCQNGEFAQLYPPPPGWDFCATG